MRRRTKEKDKEEEEEEEEEEEVKEVEDLTYVDKFLLLSQRFV